MGGWIHNLEDQVQVMPGLPTVQRLGTHNPCVITALRTLFFIRLYFEVELLSTSFKAFNKYWQIIPQKSCVNLYFSL